jgi:ribose 5-phosphate isomerase B
LQRVLSLSLIVTLLYPSLEAFAILLAKRQTKGCLFKLGYLICRGGGTGRRAGLKIRLEQSSESSSLSLGTKNLFFRAKLKLKRAPFKVTAFIMNITVASDHRGTDLEQKLTHYLQSQSLEVQSASPKNHNPEDDYPLITGQAVKEYLKSSGSSGRLILICGGGHGVCMAANRFKGIRASLACSVDSITAARADDDINTLCLAADFLPQNWAEIVNVFLQTPFKEDPKYARRKQELDSLS